jgi:hypothetical protein
MFIPYKHITLSTRLKKEAIINRLSKEIDPDAKPIYWGKKFYKSFTGKISGDRFFIRPVVPYWNISPLEIRGKIDERSDEWNNVTVKITSPLLRIIIPLAALAIILFFVSFALQGKVMFFLTTTLIILLVSYIAVNIPFQIQLTKTLIKLKKILKK